MATILYLPSDNGLVDRFCEVLNYTIPGKPFAICHTLEELSRQLRDPQSIVKVAVLCVMDKEEIEGITALGEVIENVKLIFILAYDDRETIMMAHRLRPRYITWLDSDFRNVAGVLKRLVALYDDPSQSGEKGRHMPKRSARRDSFTLGEKEAGLYG